MTREYSPLAATELNTDLQASAQVMAPYSSSALTITVSEISTDANSNATVQWSGSWPNSSQALTKGSSFTLPSSLSGANITVIYGQVSYGYVPTLGYNMVGPITLSDHIYLYPRTGTSISCCS